MTDQMDLRAAARALLAGDFAEPLGLRREALRAILAIARSETPVLAGALEPQAAVRDDLDVRGGVAIVGLQGVLTPRGSLLSLLFGGGLGGLQGFRRDLAAAVGSSDVEAIVLDVHSPGGLIGMIPETAAEVRAARDVKPIVAVANTMTASAAYWIASQATEVVSTPSGFVGSIGVYLIHEDWSANNEKVGVDPTYIYAGRYKVDGHFDEPLSDTAREAFQAEVNDLYELFVNDVALGRGTTPDDVRAGYGEGRVLPAARAVTAGLADRVATIDETVLELSGDGGRGRLARKASAGGPTIRANAEPGEVSAEVRARLEELAHVAPPQPIHNAQEA